MFQFLFLWLFVYLLILIDMINVNSLSWVYKCTPNYRNKTITIRAYEPKKASPVRKWRTYPLSHDDFVYYGENCPSQRDILQLINHSGECYLVK